MGGSWMRIAFFVFGIGVCATASPQQAEPRLTLNKLTTSAERIRSHGYPAESHYVETSDGYLLNVFRLPYSHKSQKRATPRPAILLQHGLLSNSDCWLSNGPDNSLAYLLADAGYDVWLGNARGNIYSRHNTHIAPNNWRFWNFSWHEIGVLDIAAIIDYILYETNHEPIHYVGHSQGTTAYFVLMAERPEYNAKIKSAHMLAPCAFFGHGTSFIFKLLVPLVGEPGGIWNTLLEDMELIPQNPVVSRLIDTSCGANPLLGSHCKNMYLWFTANGYENTNMTSLQVLLETHPAGASSNQAIHYIQLYKQGRFGRRDFGRKKNQQIYKQDSPPDYDLSKITAPTYFYSSDNDALCAPGDVDKLVSHMPQLVDNYRVENPSWNHLDFIVANQMKEVINDRIIAVCDSYENLK